MKRVLSIIILLILLFLIFEFGVNYLKSGHEVSYKIYANDIAFNVKEIYTKNKNEDVYNIEISNEKEVFYYVLNNNYNKQKKIIKAVEYFNDNDNSCIYPILLDETGTYLECIKDNKIYTKTSYSNQDYIKSISSILTEKKYNINKQIDTTNTDKHGSSTVYKNNLLENDIISLWTYKGIHTFTLENYDEVLLLSFDKYENNIGILVDNYYLFPDYQNNKVLEFSKINIANINNTEDFSYLEIGYTLSSRTYINGVIDNKVYYTDPSNLIQIEVNLENKNVRLIGSKEIGGQMYNGKWEDRNIYDFVSNKILFTEPLPNLSKYSYRQLKEGTNSYYFYNSQGEVYQVSKNNLEVPILLFKVNGINNFNVIDDTIYYVVNDTLYYYSNSDGIVPIIKNNELKYNTTNRISVYRKS